MASAQALLLSVGPRPGSIPPLSAWCAMVVLKGIN